MKTFYFEMTDIFCGELNYCWLNRFEVKAKNIRGALIKLSKETGFNYKNNGLYYKAKNACVALYEYHGGIDSPDKYWLEKAIKLG